MDSSVSQSSALPHGAGLPRVSALPHAPAPPHAPDQSRAPVLPRSWTLRAILIAGCALSIGAAVWVSDPTAYLQADPALARLLRGMALIKAVAVLSAVAAVFWRFGRRVTPPQSSAYILGSSMLAGTTMLIWQLSWIVTAAIAFHAALLGLLLAAWRDDGRAKAKLSPRRSVP